MMGRSSPVVRNTLRLIPILVAGLVGTCEAGEEPRTLLELGRDYPETRLFSACTVSLRPDRRGFLAVAGFSQTGEGDVADLAVFELANGEALLQWRVMRRSEVRSSIRTLRASDLDGDGRDELIALGRIGDEHVDSQGELQVYRWDDDYWHLVTKARWQSGTYTHGFGMDVVDVDGDGRPEIVTGGFFFDGTREQAQLRVWRFRDGDLHLVASQQWGSDAGGTRINSVCIGDISGDGSSEIITAGRTGQVRGAEDSTQAEADQLVVWRLDDGQLKRVTSYESEPGSRSRFREVKLADLDGRPGLEILAAGRIEGLQRRGPGNGSGTGRGDGSGGGRGGGRGDGSGGGRGNGRTAEGMRPLLSIFRLEADQLTTTASPEFQDTFGEVRDLVLVAGPDGPRLITAMAESLKPNRQARLDAWKFDGGTLQPINHQTVALGAETRARQIVVWRDRWGRQRVLTVGFVQRDGQILGQILDWGDVGQWSSPAAK